MRPPCGVIIRLVAANCSVFAFAAFAIAAVSRFYGWASSQIFR
jgi:hypothetical protein